MRFSLSQHKLFPLRGWCKNYQEATRYDQIVQQLYSENLKNFIYLNVYTSGLVPALRLFCLMTLASIIQITCSWTSATDLRLVQRESRVMHSEFIPQGQMSRWSSAWRRTFDRNNQNFAEFHCAIQHWHITMKTRGVFLATNTCSTCPVWLTATCPFP